MTLSAIQGYIALVEYLVMNCFLFGAIFLAGSVLRSHYNSKSMYSYMLTTYLTAILVQSLISLPNALYMTVSWNVVPAYNGVVIFYTGICTHIAIIQFETITFFLIAERLMILHYPFWFTPARQRMNLALAFIVGPMIWGPMIPLALQYPIECQTQSACWAINCSVENFRHGYFIYAKVTLTSINVFMGFVFGISLRRYQNAVAALNGTASSALSRKQKLSHKIVLYSFIQNIVLDVLPSTVDLILNNVTDLTLSHHIGPYSRLGSFCGVFFSTCIYFKMLQRSHNTSTTKHVIGTRNPENN